MPSPDIGSRPTVLFLCVHNAGRSQMALGWFNHLAGGRAVGVVRRVRTRPTRSTPRRCWPWPRSASTSPRSTRSAWTDEIVQAADVVVTMGCGDACPFVPGKRYEDWELDDPAGQDLDAVRPIRDEIERRVRALLASLGITVT